ncbi:hypothetical protein L486_05544 [Kwoniella mangroviensis CBS 10435]|uniref:Uncharacterized protein n=1 Tax=Kwoniella mangroviensis CBS 10435 TaxID=1331196 RepID=A0A1B9IMU1_9TREE|nr:hypothetical protein L486_05544 [Kwoniella mangroviensis CBS 10435]
MTSETPSPSTHTQETKNKVSFIERLLRLYPIQGNHHLPPPTTQPTSPSQNVRLVTPVDIRALEAFLGPIGRPRRSSITQRRDTLQPTMADIESQSQPHPTTQWSKPTIKQVIRASPRRMIYLSILLGMIVGIVVGWVIFIHQMTKLSKSKEKKEEKDKSGVDTLIVVGDGCFILILLTTLFFILRHSLKIYAHFRPPSSPLPSQSGNTTMTEAPWTLPPLPTYVDAVGRQQRTGVVEDRYISGECPPKYGDERGSKLLLRSISRMAEDQDLDGRQGRMEVVTRGAEQGPDNAQDRTQEDERGLEVQLDADDDTQTQDPNHGTRSIRSGELQNNGK